MASMTTQVALSLSLMLLIGACATAPEVKEARSYSFLQSQADFALGCRATFVTLTHYKRWPMRVGASCDGRRIIYKRSHPKLADWVPEMTTGPHPK